PVEAARRELVAVQLGATAVIVRDEEALRVGVPIRGDLAGKIDRELLLAISQRVPDDRAGDAAALVDHDEPAVARDGRPARGLQSLARSVPLLRDGGAVRNAQHPQRAIAAVAVLGVREHDQRLIPREISDARALRVPVEQPVRAPTVDDEVRARALVAARPADDREAAAEREAGAVRRRELRGDRLAPAAGEPFADPAAELVPLRVVEPPHALARRLQPRWDAIARALRSVGQLAMRVRAAVPGMHLELPAEVREV